MAENGIDKEMITGRIGLSNEEFDELFGAHIETVYHIALNLTPSEVVVGEVVEEVFVKLYHEMPLTSDEPIENVIHRLAYEIALSRLVGEIQQHKQSVHEIHSEDQLNTEGKAPSEPTNVTPIYDEMEHDWPDPLDRASWAHRQTRLMLLDLAKRKV